ncbi:MAG: hypothetical protein EPGJADBJ_03919 [Saprospiraceae bacterium]|nr:hypothetical protein [Saprospiraceae bacterium]
MAKTIFLCCLLAAFVAPLSAQQADTTDLDYEFFKRSRGSWDFAAGGRVNFYNFDDMNHILNQAGLADLEPEATGLFVASRASSKNSRWSGESSFDAVWTYANGGRVLNGGGVLYRDYALNFRLLYDVSHRARLTKLFPFIGLGMGYQVLRTYQNLPGNGNFVMTLSQNVKKNRFDCFSLPLEAGLSLEQGFKTRIYDIFLGIRGGYTYRALRSDWALDGDINVDLPQPDAGAPFLAFSVRFKTDPARAWEAFKKRRKSH